MKAVFIIKYKKTNLVMYIIKNKYSLIISYSKEKERDK